MFRSWVTRDRLFEDLRRSSMSDCCELVERE